VVWVLVLDRSHRVGDGASTGDGMVMVVQMWVLLVVLV